jgi:hypothetical protein
MRSVVDVTAGSVVTDVIYLISIRDLPVVELPYGTVEHLYSPCPPLPEVAVTVRLV